MSAKNAEYYLSLVYDLVLRKVNADGEGMYMVYTRELDKDVFYGVGTTIDEAIDSFNSVKEELFVDFVDRGLHIPEPQVDDEELHSGNFIVRTSPNVHAKLVAQARTQKQSLNALINSLLVQYTTGWDLVDSFKQTIVSAVKLSSTQIDESWHPVEDKPVAQMSGTLKDERYAKAS